MAHYQEPNSNNSAQDVRAYIGLGSNAGDRVAFIQQAMQLLKDVPEITVVECSSLYETEPVPNNNNARWFVNAVASIDCTLSPENLLDACKDIEHRLAQLHCEESGSPELNEDGSKRRIIDLDILFYGDTLIKRSNLSIPHPRIHQRAYALVPLLEIAPDVMHPGFDKTAMELHEDLPEPEQVFLYGTRDTDSDFS
jgi:2-amino-4-hydroxy-6-hydroxymethyldihydropteridine diphosphokinase